MSTGNGDERLCVLQIVSMAAGRDGQRSVGGPERRALEALKHWDYSRLRLVVAYSPDGRLWPDFAAASAANASITLVPFDPPRRRDWRSLPRLVRLIRAHRIDVVHTQGPHGTDWWAAVAARLAGRAAIVTRPIALVDYSLAPGTFRRFRRLDRLALSAVHRLVFVSEDARRKALGSGEGRPARAMLVRNGVDVDRFAPRDKNPSALGLPAQAPTFGMIAQLLPVKGWDAFLDVVELVRRQIADVRALAIGDGPERERLHAEAARRGLADAVVFTGFRADTSEVLRQLDVLILTSQREGMPVALIEGMAMARPVVAMDAGGIRELVRHGETGFVEPAGDAGGIARRVVELLRDPARRHALGAAARAVAVGEHSIQAMVRGYESLYLAAHADRAGRRRPDAVLAPTVERR